MARIRPLARPPITEAVVDFQLKFGEKRELQAFGSFGDAIANTYPKKQTRKQLALRIEVAGEPVQHINEAGYVYRSADGLDIVQTRSDGFAFGRLAPYQSWDSMLDEGWRQWQLYREMFRPTDITRLSTRFINRLQLPGPALDFDDYLLVGPRLPQGVPERIASYSTVVAIPEIRTSTRAMVRQVFDGATTDMTLVPVLLDIDVVRECNVAADNKAHINAALDELRRVKNEVFFGCVTEKAVSLFE